MVLPVPTESAYFNPRFPEGKRHPTEKEQS